MAARLDDLTDAEIALRPHRVRGAVANSLLDRGAITPRRAVPCAPAAPDARRELTRLRDAGVVKSTGDGRCWLDLRRHAEAQAHRERIRAMIAVPVAVVLALVAMLFYRG